MNLFIRRVSGNSGFTLIEVVIALTLISMIMLGLVSAMSSFGQTAARMELKARDGDAVSSISQFLRQTIAHAATLPMSISSSFDAPSAWGLDGMSNEVRWLGLMPARHGMGGLYHLRLHVSNGALLLQYLPYQPSFQETPWDDLESRVLLTDVSEVRFSYRALNREDWLSEWSNAYALPGWVRVDFVDRHWPALLIRVLAAEPIPE